MKCLVLLSWFALAQQDSINLTDSIQPVVFKEVSYKHIEYQNINFEYKQGFFCDFEDKISKNRKMRFNLGLYGKQ